MKSQLLSRLALGGLALGLALVSAAAVADEAKPRLLARPVPHVISNSLGMKLVEIPAGEFVMGSHESAESLAKAFPDYEPARFEQVRDELPAHKVRISRPFFLGQHEVTIGQFRQFVTEAAYETESERDGTGGYGFNPQLGDFEGRKPQYSWRNPSYPQADGHPVVNITWNDGVAFCDWLSRKEGARYRLPSEAEWEYACRAGTTTRYSFGDDPRLLPKFANMYDATTARQMPNWKKYASEGSDNFAFTAPVGSFLPNPWGLYDMHGNVWEWTGDRFGEGYYARSPGQDPRGPETGKSYARRGGAWHTWPLYLRSSFRNFNTPQSRYVNLGLRVLLEIR